MPIPTDSRREAANPESANPANPWQSRPHLVSLRCEALIGAAHRLSEASINAALTLLPAWQVQSGELVRVFAFADYYRSIAFVNAVAFVAHAQDHHPELSVHYNRVQVRFSTHDVGGLSRNDVICAALVEQLFAE